MAAYRPRKRPAKRSKKPLILAGAALLVVVLWLLFRGVPGSYRTLVSTTVGLHSIGWTPPYTTDGFDIEQEAPLARVEVEVFGEVQTANVFIFTPEEYNHWYEMIEGKAKEPREIVPIWSKKEVKVLVEEEIPLPGPGRYILVIHNHKWNDAAVKYRFAVK